ncbi:DUF4250 domain-containing protein [Anaerostipes sp. 494a]|uniref:DUF4250 domain-containing protein n=1 Tax=unclassified Anaerostipes TaxID=2635253 RepID=UPI000952E557|nr:MULTISPECIES: DUF4250 domain-containing protein [unclassified Anaerostipes]MCI5622974.1 DUF4250 domain-containing protein [Anaerostipes sp.]MDY2725314.1 DUF4250 domain-containing protein [Anaerostipes faecalis]OLR58942.1 DUF4250 domain-containing protein [Anaerostipes sp. 494a]
MIPKDPVIMLSYINTQLRDYYDSFEELCKSLNLDQEDIAEKLKSIGYEYQRKINQFR